MDHISNFLNFSSAGGNTDDMNKSHGIPIFDDLPLDLASSPQSSEAPSSTDTSHASSSSSAPNPPANPAQIDAAELKKRLYTLKDDISSIIRLLEITDGKFPLSPAFPSSHIRTDGSQASPPSLSSPSFSPSASGEQILEGVFSGEKMIGPDGHEYAVPPNYASKSKLVEGDHMKLTITAYGKFIYKQIGPIERKRIIGVLQFDEATQLWSVVHEGKNYKILTASATFYHGKPGDHVVILVPKDIPSSWGAVENIIAS